MASSVISIRADCRAAEGRGPAIPELCSIDIAQSASTTAHKAASKAVKAFKKGATRRVGGLNAKLVQTGEADQRRRPALPSRFASDLAPGLRVMGLRPFRRARGIEEKRYAEAEGNHAVAGAADYAAATDAVAAGAEKAGVLRQCARNRRKKSTTEMA
jgi:hypothetical protein